MNQTFQATSTLLGTNRPDDSTASPTDTLRAGSGLRTGSTSKPPRNGHTYRIVAYLRVSHSLQADNYTFETQLARIHEKLDSFYGAGAYELEVHQDEGLSGGYGPTPTGVEKRTRASLLELQAKLQSGHYDGLIVYKLNRLFRSYRWLGQWIEDVLIPCSADIISATEDLDFNTSQGRAFIMMIAIFDASAREGMAERNCDAQRTRAESGYLLGPPPTAGSGSPEIKSLPVPAPASYQSRSTRNMCSLSWTGISRAGAAPESGLISIVAASAIPKGESGRQDR